MSSPYIFEYERAYDFALDRTAMWDALLRTDRYETWWEWMRDLRVEGSPATPGSVFSFAVVAPIPFSMHLRVRVEEVVPERSIAASVEGDLRGRALMRFEDQPNGCRATVSWSVELMQRALRVGARVAHPVLRWGQDWAVGTALRGFERHLRGAAD